MASTKTISTVSRSLQNNPIIVEQQLNQFPRNQLCSPLTPIQTNMNQLEEDLLIRLSRRLPGLGVSLAFMSGVCFATAGFTVELVPKVDATVVIVYRYVVIDHHQLFCCWILMVRSSYNRSVFQLVLYAVVGSIELRNSTVSLFGIVGERRYIVIRSVASFIGR